MAYIYQEELSKMLFSDNLFSVLWISNATEISVAFLYYWLRQLIKIHIVGFQVVSFQLVGPWPKDECERLIYSSDQCFLYFEVVYVDVIKGICVMVDFIGIMISTRITRFMEPTWGPSGASRNQVGPMLAPWTLSSGNVRKRKYHICIPIPIMISP